MRLVRLIAAVSILAIPTLADAREPTLVIESGDCSYEYYVDYLWGFIPTVNMEVTCVSVDVIFEGIEE